MKPLIVRPDVGPAELEREVELFLTRPNVHLISRGHYPPLLTSGVRYRREPLGQERWKPIDVLYADGYGDCEDLSAALAAQLRARGVPARVVVRKTGLRLFHALVGVGRGETITLIDPSKMLGM